MSTNSVFVVNLNNMNYNVGQNVGLKLKPKERQEKTIGIILKK